MSTISSVAIIGAGTMGAGIAITTLCAGLPTVLIDRSAESLERAIGRLDAFLDRAVAKGRMSTEEARMARSRLRSAQDYGAVGRVDLVIEAVFEKLEIKTELMRALEPLVREDCILATNTSCLCVTDISEALERPERFIGLHYFSPAEINPVVEVVLGRATDPGLVPRLRPFLERTGKVALPCKDRNGFALNRFFCPYVNEAVRCHEEGLGSPAQIDAVACELFGLAIGPFATTNIVGAPVMLHALEKSRIWAPSTPRPRRYGRWPKHEGSGRSQPEQSRL